MPDPYSAAIGIVVQGATAIANKAQQDRVQEAFSKQNPIANADTPIEFTVASAEVRVPHKFGEVPSGWHVVSQNGPGEVYESQAPDASFFYFTSTSGTDITVKILVY